MATVAKLTEQGELKIAGNIDTRLPLVTDGLVAHFPMDGRGGTFDMISGYQSTQNTSVGVNLIEAMTLDWRDPASWTGSNATTIWSEEHQAIEVTGYHNMNLATPVVIDTSKEYQISIEVMETVESDIGLYLGGYSLNKDGVRATTNYDYTMASNYEPGLDNWVTYKITRTGTAVAGNGLSLSFDTVKGWDGGAAIADPIIRFYHLGGLFNYNANGVLYVRNPKIVVLDADTSNTTITDDGIAIESTTTNVQTSHPNLTNVTSEEGAYQPGWLPELHTTAISQNAGWGNGYNSGADPSNKLYHAQWVLDKEHNDICVLFRDEPSPIDGSYPAWLGVSRNLGVASTIGITDNMDVTVSWLQKTNDLGKAVNLGLYHMREIEASNGFETNIGSGFNTRLDEWQRVSFTSNTGTNWNLSSIFYYYVYGHYGSNGTVFAKDFQLELNKTYATAFTKTSRSSNGYLTYPSDYISPTSGSFVVNFMYESYENSPTAYLDMLDFRDSGSNNFLIIRKNATNLVPTTMYLRSGATWLSISIDTHLIPGEENSLVWTWDTTTGYTMYVNNIIVKTGTTYAVSDQAYYEYSFARGWKITSHSVYNRRISTEEVNKLVKGTHSITSTGLITNQVNTRPVENIKTNHYPFDFDARIYNKYVIPTTENNTVYETDIGGVFVGKSNINLYADGNYALRELHTVAHGPWSFPTNQHGPSGQSVIRIDADGTSSYHGRDIIVTDTETYTASCLMYVSEDCDETNARLAGEGSHAPDAYYDHTKNGTWQKLSTTTAVIGTSSRLLLYVSNMTKGYMLATEFQYELNDYVTPFSLTSRAPSKLYYDKVFTQNSNFTINIFATGLRGDNTLDLFCDDSDRWNGQLRVSVANTVELLLREDLRGTVHNTYATGVNFVSQEKNMFTLVSIAGYGCKVFVNGQLSASYPLWYPEYTQISVGRNGMGDAAVKDAHLQDLVYLDSSLSDEEIEAIFKTKMKAYPDELLIQNEIQTGASL